MASGHNAARIYYLFPGYPRGVLAKFAAHVTSASEGAVTDKDLKL